MDNFFVRLFKFALFVLFTIITGGLYLLYFWSTRTEEIRNIQVDILQELREMNGKPTEGIKTSTEKEYIKASTEKEYIKPLKTFKGTTSTGKENIKPLKFLSKLLSKIF